ncbi:MAG TPA: hypothetical protein VHV57_16930 [Acidimicrobiales bacterium]|jgi:hypothetical protein|nr:hypothetical protein [Acidimicrobiales bacterium]
MTQRRQQLRHAVQHHDVRLDVYVPELIKTEDSGLGSGDKGGDFIELDGRPAKRHPEVM